MTDKSETFSTFPGRGKQMRLGVKFAFLGAIGVLVTAAALLSLAIWQSQRYNNLAQAEVDALINADLDHITQSVYNLVRTENEAVQSTVDANLNVARHVLAATGSVTLSKNRVHWTATNQFTGQSEEADLPELLLGETRLGQNRDMSVETPVVDEVSRLVGETATVFQRMNERGDMLRVATTVRDSAGNRAIGTFIPAVDPDGGVNRVISAIQRGETYHGRAFVVNEWYLTAYEPLRDDGGDLVGMLYVGIRQKSVEARIRHAILNTQVGKTGYVYVLAGKGENRGMYIISREGKRDGEDVWRIRDSDDQFVIRKIIGSVVAVYMLKPPWQHSQVGDPP